MLRCRAGGSPPNEARTAVAPLRGVGLWKAENGGEMARFDYGHLDALREILRTGSFEHAAAVLGVTPSAVSQRIRALEERLGAVLIHRGNPCTATEPGMRLYRHAEEVALLESGLADDLGGLTETGPRRLRIAVNADSLATWLPEALLEAAQIVPDFRFDLILDDQDHSADWLRRGEVMAAISAHRDPVQGCDSVPLGALRYFATASPGFMATHFPDGVTIEGMRRAPVLVFNRKDSLQARWVAMKLGKAVESVPHFLPSSQAFVDAALLGLGWGMNPASLVRAHLSAGRLVALDPMLPLDTPLFWQVSRVARDALAPLGQAVRQAARRGLVQA